MIMIFRVQLLLLSVCCFVHANGFNVAENQLKEKGAVKQEPSHLKNAQALKQETVHHLKDESSREEAKAKATSPELSDQIKRNAVAKALAAYRIPTKYGAIYEPVKKLISDTNYNTEHLPSVYSPVSYPQPTPVPYTKPTPAPYTKPTPAPYTKPTPAPYKPTPVPYNKPTPAPYVQPTPAPYEASYVQAESNYPSEAEAAYALDDAYNQSSDILDIEAQALSAALVEAVFRKSPTYDPTSSEFSAESLFNALGKELAYSLAERSEVLSKYYASGALEQTLALKLRQALSANQVTYESWPYRAPTAYDSSPISSSEVQYEFANAASQFESELGLAPDYSSPYGRLAYGGQNQAPPHYTSNSPYEPSADPYETNYLSESSPYVSSYAASNYDTHEAPSYAYNAAPKYATASNPVLTPLLAALSDALEAKEIAYRNRQSTVTYQSLIKSLSAALVDSLLTAPYDSKYQSLYGSPKASTESLIQLLSTVLADELAARNLEPSYGKAYKQSPNYASQNYGDAESYKYQSRSNMNYADQYPDSVAYSAQYKSRIAQQNDYFAPQYRQYDRPAAYLGESSSLLEKLLASRNVLLLV